VTVTLRTRSGKTRSARLVNRAYRTTASKATFTLRIRVSTKLRSRARGARTRSLVFSVRPTLPAGARQSATLRLAKPYSSSR
jgi:hypothetical protein